MPLNFDLAGKTYEPSRYRVEAGPVEAYAAATGNRLHSVGERTAAPPLFPVVPAFQLMVKVSGDPDLGIEDPLKILHGEQELRYHRPLLVGDDVVVTPVLRAVEDKGIGATVVVELGAATPAGEPVVVQWWTLFVRDAGTGRRRRGEGRRQGPEGLEEAARFDRRVEEDMPKRYAEASGDHNPIHLDDHAARSVGLPGVINHGLGTMALVSQGLVDRLAQEDPTRLRRLAARFTAPVFPGQDLSTTVWRTGQDGLYVYEVVRPDGRRVVTGEVEVA